MQCVSLFDSEIVIYGAGYCGLMFSELLMENGIKPLCFLDRNSEKQKLRFNGIKIYSPNISDYKDKLVVVCVLDICACKKIKKDLYDMGYANVKIIYDYCCSSELFKNQPLIFHVPDNWVSDNSDKITKVENLLSDSCSVETYKKIIGFVSGNYDLEIPSFSIDEQYFAYDVYKRINDEVFLDCGAFRGDMLRFFAKNNEGIFKEYYAIEPDPENYKRIESLKEASDDRVHIIKCAVSDKEQMLCMKNYLNENSRVCKDGFSVPAFTLDQICKENNIVPTFIKIDVEGFEEKLLNGALNVIKKYQPTIAIAIYHNLDDLWKIPLKIREMLPKHGLYIRSYMNINELILYAVPKERRIG